jgi:hypothetical protein
MKMDVEQLIQSLLSAGIKRAKARYVVADALAIERGYAVQNGADGARLLSAADAEIEGALFEMGAQNEN